MKRSIDLVGVALVAAAFLVVALAYHALPAVIPTHWNARGIPNGFMPKSIGAFILPLLSLGLVGLFALLPVISPRGFEMKRFQGAYLAMLRAILAFNLYLTCVVTIVGLGKSTPLDVAALTEAGFGCLLAVLGNYMTKLRKNFFVGIRTPWTLANDEVWARTHRLGGRLMAACGVFMLLAALAGKGLIVVPVVLLMTLVTFGYSYVIYRRLESSPR